VRREQENAKDGTPEEALHSAILWDMFTGGRNYTEIFYSAISPRSQLSLIKGFLGELWNRYITSRG
jgi:hypothetical protein